MLMVACNMHTSNRNMTYCSSSQQVHQPERFTLGKRLILRRKFYRAFKFISASLLLIAPCPSTGNSRQSRIAAQSRSEQENGYKRFKPNQPSWLALACNASLHLNRPANNSESSAGMAQELIEPRQVSRRLDRMA
jgi:hypothetical protein